MMKRSRIIIPCTLLVALVAIVISRSISRVHASELGTTSLLSDTNLKAYYQLEADCNDQKGNYNLAEHNSPQFTSGRWGNGMDLGAANTTKYCETSNNMGITSGAITISLWVKLNSEMNSGQSPWGLAGLGNSTTNNEYWIDYVYSGGARKIEFRRSNQMVNQAVQDYNISLGTNDWHHLVLTYDGTTLYGYVDNDKTAGVAASGTGSSSVLDHFTIGVHNENGVNAGTYASAAFDDVAVFNRALTDQEVSTLYAADSSKLAALRTADNSISSNTTPQTDSQLVLSLGHKTYTIDGIIFAKSTNAAPGIKFDFSATSASFMAIGYSAVNDTIHTGGMLTATGSTVIVPATAGAVIPIRFDGTVTMSQAGDLAFQWAQSISSSDAMTVMNGSYLRVQEIQ